MRLQSSFSSVPELLERQAERHPRRVAVREKRYGLWREITWSEYAQAVREVALGLDAEGLGPGSRIAVFAPNGPNVLFADLGIQALGAASVGLYVDSDPADLEACLRGASVRWFICGGQEQVDVLLSIRGSLDGVDRIIVFETKGLHTAEYSDLPIETFEALRARGHEHVAGTSRFAEILASRSPDEVAYIAFTSGTTDLPRGVCHSHAASAMLASTVAQWLGLSREDRVFSLLPLGHPTARIFDVYAPVISGASVSFAESPETVASDLREVRPTVLVATPRLLERVRADVELRMRRAGRFKRYAYRRGMSWMTDAVAGITRGRRRSLRGWLGQLAVGRWIVEKAGFARLRYGGVCGSFVAPEAIAWFWALGLPMREQYGQVETGGLVSSQRSPMDLGTLGPPVHAAIEVDVRDGELLVKSPALGVSYLDGSPLSEDGWYRTGDIGHLDDEGRLILSGRKGSVQRTTAGEVISVADLESRIKVSPYVASAVVVAEGRPFVTALVEISEESVAEWAREQGLPVTTYAALSSTPEVVELIGREVNAACEDLPEPQRVRALRLLPRPLDEELTPTGKIRRRVIEEKWASLLDEMYADASLEVGAHE